MLYNHASVTQGNVNIKHTGITSFSRGCYLPSLLRLMLPSVGGFAISSDGYFSSLTIYFIFDFFTRNYDKCGITSTMFRIIDIMKRNNNNKRVVGWCDGAGFTSSAGASYNLVTVGQGPIALAVGADGGGLDIFTLIYTSSSFSLSLGDGPI